MVIKDIASFGEFSKPFIGVGLPLVFSHGFKPLV